MTSRKCPWCGCSSFKARKTGGSAQRFCSTTCRTQFWSAAHRWIARAMALGLLSPEMLKAVNSSSLNAVSGPS
jgi:hypothetical protein